jgi:hypothetical protein
VKAPSRIRLEYITPPLLTGFYAVSHSYTILRNSGATPPQKLITASAVFRDEPGESDRAR